MSVLAVLALHAGHVLAQWFDYPREVYIRDTYNLSWDLSNDKGADEPVSQAVGNVGFERC